MTAEADPMTARYRPGRSAILLGIGLSAVAIDSAILLHPPSVFRGQPPLVSAIAPSEAPPATVAPPASASARPAKSPRDLPPCASMLEEWGEGSTIPLMVLRTSFYSILSQHGHELDALVKAGGPDDDALFVRIKGAITGGAFFPVDLMAYRGSYFPATATIPPSYRAGPTILKDWDVGKGCSIPALGTTGRENRGGPDVLGKDVFPEGFKRAISSLQGTGFPPQMSCTFEMSGIASRR